MTKILITFIVCTFLLVGCNGSNKTVEDLHSLLKVFNDIESVEILYTMSDKFLDTVLLNTELKFKDGKDKEKAEIIEKSIYAPDIVSLSNEITYYRQDGVSYFEKNGYKFKDEDIESYYGYGGSIVVMDSESGDEMLDVINNIKGSDVDISKKDGILRFQLKEDELYRVDNLIDYVKEMNDNLFANITVDELTFLVKDSNFYGFELVLNAENNLVVVSFLFTNFNDDVIFDFPSFAGYTDINEIED